MKLLRRKNSIKLVHSDCIDYMQFMHENSVDSIVTDPPYELNFMSNKWDCTGISFQKETWEKCIRVLKPGGFLLALGCPKNVHRMVCALEDAGFKIVDEIFYLYGTGMPHGQSIGKAIESKLTNGSANTKDFKKLDGIKAKTSIGYNNIHVKNDRPNNYNGLEYNKEVFFHTKEGEYYSDFHTQLKPATEVIVVAQKPISERTFAENILKWGTGAFNIGACRISGGRFPANVILDEESAKILDKQSGVSKSTGGASRFFFCAKASKAEKNLGCENLSRGNNHVTVKPVALMQYLVRLVTPLHGLVFDPFMGSGTTGIACVTQGFKFIGIEKDKDYYSVAKCRIDAWK